MTNPISSVDLQGTTAAAPVAQTSPVEQFLNLPRNTHGEQVSGLQRAVNIFSGHLLVDSIYGPLTEGATRSFRDATHPTLERGSGYRRDRRAVRSVQRALNALNLPGVARLEVDGKLGEHTEKALIAWQKSQGETNPERLGKLTDAGWDNLFVAVANKLGGRQAERPPEQVTRMSTRNAAEGLQTPTGTGVSTAASRVATTTPESPTPAPETESTTATATTDATVSEPQAPIAPPRLTHEQLSDISLHELQAPPEDGTSPVMQHLETKGTTDARGREVTNPQERVILLEQLLNAAEGRETPVTGEYTEQLAKRVLTFQKRYSISSDGIAGPGTFEKALEVARANTPEPAQPIDLTSPIDFNAVLGGQTLRLGDHGPVVGAMKRLIHELGIPVDIDSGDRFTTETEAAVTDLQERLRVATRQPIGIDGVFGSGETLPNAVAAWQESRSPEWQAEHIGDDGQVAGWGQVNKGAQARNAPVELQLAPMPSEADLIPRFTAIGTENGAPALALQQELQRLGYDIGDDGEMGPSTRAAVADARDLYTILTGNQLPEGIAGTRIAMQHMLFPGGSPTETSDPNAVTLMHTLPESMREGRVRRGRGNTRVVVRQLAPDGVYTVNSRSGGQGMLETRAALSFVAMRDRIRAAGMTEEFRSGWRSYEHQAYLRQLYARRGGVARPGASLHHDGREVDFVIRERGGFGWLETNASRYGFSFPGHKLANGTTENWAWTHAGVVTSTVSSYWRVPTSD